MITKALARLVILGLTVFAVTGLNLFVSSEASARSIDSAGTHISDHADAGHDHPNNRQKSSDSDLNCGPMIGHCAPAHAMLTISSLGPASARCSKFLTTSVDWNELSLGVEPPPPRF